MEIDPILTKITSLLKDVHGVSAIVLGGSWASGTQRADSDIDLGIYYEENNPLDIEGIKKIASELNDLPNPVVTKLGEWGKWVNGGAWLTIRGQRVDLLYRNLDFISSVINDTLSGIKVSDYYQQPPYGFQSYIYCAEIKICKILFDSNNSISTLKDKLQVYPPALRKTIINEFLWDAQFSLEHAKKSARRGEVYVVTGCLTKIMSDLVQVLYAINDVFFIGDKHLYQDVTTFKNVPVNFLDRLKKILGNPGLDSTQLNYTVDQAETLFQDFRELCGNEFIPKF